jgi:putative SOS response-associated peptidase YedK
MCGRYASARSRIELLEEFEVQRDRVDESLKPDYNVAPTKPVYAVMTRQPRAETADAAASGKAASGNGASGKAASGKAANGNGASDKTANGNGANGSGTAERQLRVVRWGLVPYWAKDVSIGSRMINARAETVSEKPAFRAAFAKRRCLLSARSRRARLRRSV